MQTQQPATAPIASVVRDTYRKGVIAYIIETLLEHPGATAQAIKDDRPDYVTTDTTISARLSYLIDQGVLTRGGGGTRTWGGKGYAFRYWLARDFMEKIPATWSYIHGPDMWSDGRPGRIKQGVYPTLRTMIAAYIKERRITPEFQPRSMEEVPIIGRDRNLPPPRDGTRVGAPASFDTDAHKNHTVNVEAVKSDLDKQPLPAPMPEPVPAPTPAPKAVATAPEGVYIGIPVPGHGTLRLPIDKAKEVYRQLHTVFGN